MPKCETDAKRARVSANAPHSLAQSARRERAMRADRNAKREALVISVGRLFYFRAMSVSLWYNAGALRRCAGVINAFPPNFCGFLFAKKLGRLIARENAYIRLIPA